MSSTVYYGKGSQTGYRFKDFAVDSPKKIETFVEGRATNQEMSDSLILNHKLCSPLHSSKAVGDDRWFQRYKQYHQQFYEHQ